MRRSFPSAWKPTWAAPEAGPSGAIHSAPLLRGSFLARASAISPIPSGSFQPVAVTGVFDNSFPSGSAAANFFDWGFAVEYSLPYLQSHVRDIGLREPFNAMIPLVEFAMSTQENRPGRGITTGTINPGVLYENAYFQLGVEANIPVNHESGAHVGVTIQMWIYIDDIFPRTFGHPLFGERS